jgi:hypothetical protein
VVLSSEREFLLGYLHLGYILQALIADFELSEGIYSRAKIEDTDSVSMVGCKCDARIHLWFQFGALIP